VDKYIDRANQTWFVTAAMELLEQETQRQAESNNATINKQADQQTSGPTTDTET
jgi:hypothetical protein